jgi:uncharacterized membrane protein HdeD (DUF308 family)
MAQQTPSDIVRRASALSILWGVSLIVLGMLAVGAPFVAAVAINAFVAWLLVLAGVVHLTVAFHTREAGSLIWRVLVGLAYLFFGVYLIMHPALGVASLTLVLASLFLVEGILNIALFFQVRSVHGSSWLLIDGIITLLLGLMIYRQWPSSSAMGDRHTGRREHDHQRRHACDAVIGSAQGRGHDFLEVGCLSVAHI